MVYGTAQEEALITLIEALRYRCLKYVRQPLGPMHVLAGSHASGKATFLDTLFLLERLIVAGPEAALDERSTCFDDLLWRGEGKSFELAIEAAIPPARRAMLANPDFDTVRYEAAFGLAGDAPALVSERVMLKEPAGEAQPVLFEPATILTAKSSRAVKTVVHKAANDNFYDENGKGWDHAFRLGPRKSALGNLPDDESKFPVATWLRGLLAGGLRRLTPDARGLRQPCPPEQTCTLPWAVEHVRDRREWLSRLAPALPHVAAVEIAERARDRYRYVVIRGSDGRATPSWLASEGTLRLLAVTAPAFIPGYAGVLVMDNPEAGLDPCAIEAFCNVWREARDMQVLLSTHSPAITERALPVLWFSRTPEGAAEIRSFPPGQVLEQV